MRNPETETRNLKPETRNSNPKSRTPKSETQNPIPETLNPKPKPEPIPKTRIPNPSIQNLKPEIRVQVPLAVVPRRAEQRLSTQFVIPQEEDPRLILNAAQRSHYASLLQGHAASSFEVRVEGLGADVDSEAIASVFGRFGELRRAEAAFDPGTGAALGWGRVVFARREDAQVAAASIARVSSRGGAGDVST